MNKLFYLVPAVLVVLLSYAFISHGISNQDRLNYGSEDVFDVADLGSVKDSPVELGQVKWIRDFDKGTKEAKAQNKPLLVLFQEVPGCSTASGYGKNVLSHPLIVEAIETLFVPVAIYNNHSGEDERVLKSFNEPSWNNPVVRIMTPDREELVSRLSGNYTKAGLVNAMISALKNDNKPVPQYLVLLQKELTAKSGKSEKAVFAMHCFWIGEGVLANVNGVISTEPGFMGGREVVELAYNPDVVSYNELLTAARSNNVASHVYAVNSDQEKVAKQVSGKSSVSQLGAFSPDRQPKYYMSGTLYRFVPMTNTQIARVNAAIGSMQSPDIFLSPRQLEIYKYVRANQNKDWVNIVRTPNIETAWAQTVSQMGSKLSKR
ncbi:MAG: VPGUxxT family thioredoxin-like (seleno)protein, type 2 [Thermodesulfobacteriota bacterium]